MQQPKYITKLDQLMHLIPQERKALKPVCEKYPFRTNDYYLSLINWDDPDDPIRRIIIPDTRELKVWGRLDASDERKNTKAPGLEHKYEDTALLLVNDVCGGYCRFCFRKRLFMHLNDEVTRDIGPALEYIRDHNELTNVLLTGGDPLILSTNKLSKIIHGIRQIDHVKIIRIGSKMPAFNPFRILNDRSLLEVFNKYSLPEKRIYLMTHFNHPRELTPQALDAMALIQKTGVIVCNQTPLLKGINDDPHVLAELFKKLSFAGIPPYYVFQGRPTSGNHPFAVPVEKSFRIFELARMECSGLAKRARLVMSHSTGKIEILGISRHKVYFRYHRAYHPQKKAGFMEFESNPRAYWFDDYREVMSNYAAENPYRCFGPD
ncbi:MAG: KamA family radical SAM protein [Chitinivibrionales bacterium]|nr:KamA family radical SAM protein [Chitinivibrionales bacterium]